jgi:5-methylcytosine-specific restriction endonuclease McrA
MLELYAAPPSHFDFDESKLKLGHLCKHKHDWMSTGQSLRRIRGRHCVECQKLRAQDRISSGERREFRQKKYNSLRDLGLTTRGTPLLSPVMQAALLGDEEQRAMLKAIRQSNGYPSVAKLVMGEQRRYWKENPEAKNQHDRQWGKYIYAWRYKCEPSFRRHECQRNSAKKARYRGNHTVKLCPGDIDVRFANFDNQCAFCGSSNQLIVEHFIPRSKGGPHAIGNILPACYSCNMSKFNHDPEEWYRSRPYFSETRWRKILRALGKARTGIHQLPLL